MDKIIKLNQIIKYTLGLACLLFLMGSCDIKDNKEVKPETFVRIYDNNDLTKEFIPFDLEQTSDEGFLVLGGTNIPESNFYGVYIMKIDKEGNFVSEQVLSSENVNPVSSIMKASGNYYFFCMDRLTLQTKLMRLDDSGNVTEVALLDLVYPLYSSLSFDMGSFVLLNYNREDKQTQVSRVTIAGVATQTKSFDVGFGDFDPEESIIGHLTGNGKRLPFFCGQTSSGSYYFNGFYLYTLSLAFFNINAPGDPDVGLVQGYKDERAISSLVHLTGNTFAASRFGYGDNYFMTQAQLNTTPGSISSSADIKGNLMLELESDAHVITDNVSLDGSSTVVYASDTRSKQIVLYFYDPNGGSLRGVHHLGYTNPYKVASFAPTGDGGLAVIGTTWIAGRFPRICLFKLSREEINEIMQ